MGVVLEVKDVKKHIGKREIIKGISFSVEEGQIFGFLGPNGAGKTTTIRMLVGLIKPNSGSIKIMGHDIQKEKEKALSNVGCIVENPDMYGFLTGRENLIQYAKMYGSVSKERIDEVAEIIGLKDRINDKVKKYSLGMKQRLGLGQALLVRPKLLILDEPTNGLDPVGIMDFRRIVRLMAEENKSAVFISSHILAEIQQVCDTVAFINGGEIKSVESTKESEGKGTKENFGIATSNINLAMETLSKLPFVYEVKNNEDKISAAIQYGTSPKVIAELMKNSVEVIEFYKEHKTLEDRFMQIVEGEEEKDVASNK
ncbi:ABC-2 type transport system ATP-binding protein [Clostridium acetobutylicum]|uniref:ABC transporter, ATP-binding component n=1 Tax=Clostridium acetobutylicum (strain ATCC 824 / DSM 792 / JCM 1419 / IAM 19013 / LMG 5710 / NBRC 13948 / NRRL B-527 / VKM B-1787 / 2291 / W) TaxID=272562 RepID=Q97MQ4_CLOAB|nr:MULTISPECIES: ABC transporter ATP-binding protein [Clostridium]AAK78122.1 ABC transporter, ATP-binding component [Clostridium acetobutylicum ATCC 824]ADZ19181.1 ABC transporter, ATP-binding component [Clostridium acetobutylicum EA 2018]AEI34625.1 ABC transporter, ATP-binding protein [Clostridium acetobutylicum DSM 1731]AWV81816.1 ABC transporter ATP-binding protein [Clostridium acetobutylicum]MBC2395362.1 ABC transporter ATP-binding protein [Clostridium acetobutylicum]